ncbi:MAG: tetratricopeptide repeat protein [Leptolyngbya sp. SIOISBB]|nr:tetratricopeptide repeat protein [Leptolyngbya sp. SIOISBB]
MVAMLVAVSPPLNLVRAASALPQQLAQITPTTITGQLDENSRASENGVYYNIHTFEGTAGDSLSIELTSEAFEAYVFLEGPDEELLAHDSSSGEGANSWIAVTLPTSGTYRIFVTSYYTEVTRPYALTLRPASVADVARSEALQQAAKISQQVDDLYEAEEYQDAIPLAEEVLAIHRNHLGENHPDLTTSLNNLAELYRLQELYDKAGPLHREALAIRREHFGERHLKVAQSLNNLAVLYDDQQLYDQAEPLYQESLAIRRALLEESHPLVIQSLENLAGLYLDQGRYKEAEPLYQQSLAIKRRLGEGDPDLAISLNDLALLYLYQGRYGEAESLLQESLDIRREHLGAAHSDVAQSLNNLAELYRFQGRYVEAEPLFQDALAIERAQSEQNYAAIAIVINNLALLYRLQGSHDEAELYYRESLDIRRKQLGERHLHVATSLNNLGALYRIQGRYDEAEFHLQEALAITREQLGRRHPDVTFSLQNLASLYHDQSRYGDAESSYQEAISILREQLGKRHPNLAVSLFSLSGVYHDQGKTDLVVQTFEESLSIEEWNLEINLTTLTEAQRQEYGATLSNTTNAAVYFPLQALQNEDAKKLGLTTLLRRKGRLLDAGSSSLQRLRQNLTPEDEKLLDDLVIVQQQLSALTFNSPTNLPPEQYREQLAKLEDQVTDLEKALAQRSAIFRVESEPVEIVTVQAQIPANSVLVEYARYRPYHGDFGDPRYAAYLLFPDGRIEVVDLGDAAEIDAAVQSFVGLLQNRSAQFQRSAPVPTLREEDVEQLTDNIKELVFDPISPYLQDTDHMLISPDGQLNLLPFEALQTEAGGEYLVQQFQISYLNSGRDLLKFDVIEPSQNPAVIVANPDYETASNSPLPDLGEGLGVRAERPDLGEWPGERATNHRSTELSQLQVGPLPGTAAEAEAIRPLLPNADIRTEDEATENLIKSVQAPRILHIATHGFFLPDVELPESSDLGGGLIASNDPLASSGPRGIVAENPLLRSGLALAGFNTRSSGSEDGVFTALEASQLNLFGTQLVVLSACETGLGEVANGEGVYGLRRAFALAGAETQLMSLWNVSDYGTQSLMARYYENLTAGMGRSEALREVQLDMIGQGGEYSHPYYWAAFILAGDWRPLE